MLNFIQQCSGLCMYKTKNNCPYVLLLFYMFQPKEEKRFSAEIPSRNLNVNYLQSHTSIQKIVKFHSLLYKKYNYLKKKRPKTSLFPSNTMYKNNTQIIQIQKTVRTSKLLQVYWINQIQGHCGLGWPFILFRTS